MLAKDHPALGAFLPKNKQPIQWEQIADELAHGLRHRMNCSPGPEQCPCQDHLSLYVYDEAKKRSARGKRRWPLSGQRTK